MMKAKKDILFLCQFFYPEYISSATLPFDTATALKNAGYTVDALCGYPREYAAAHDLPKRDEQDGIGIHRVSYIQLDRKRKLSRLVNYFSFTFVILLHLFEMAQYQTIIVYSNPPVLPWIAAWAKKFFHCKLVFVAYDLYPEIAVRTEAMRSDSLLCRLMQHINQAVFSCADRVVALSSEMKEYIVQNRPIPEERLSVIPNWYQDRGQCLQAGPENRFYEELGKSFVVSYFGNMGTVQDLDTILDTIRLLRDDETVKFLFAGHGNKMELLRKAVSEEALRNVRICDFLHGKDFRDALEISSCAVVSLVKGTTGLCVPSKTYSYMMQGIPLLVIMEPSDIVRDVEAGAGMRVESGDSEGMAAAIRHMRDHPESVRQMREVCRRLYLEKYTTETATRQYVDMIRQLYS